MTRRERNEGIDSRVLFDSHPLPMWIYDLETLAFLAVNAAAVRQYGYSRKEFLARTIKEIRPEEDVPALLEKVAHPAPGLDHAGVWRHRKKDGSIIEVEIVSHPIRFAGRRAKLVLASEVTQRRRLEQALQETADDWRRTFDAMSDAVALVNREGVIYRCNKAMATLVGRDFTEIVGSRCYEVVHQTTGRIDGCPVAEMMATGKRATATLPVGSRTFRVTADPLFDESGGFAGAIHVMTDVTQQERSERILHDLALQQEALLNNIPDIAWLKDDQSRFLAVNEAFGKASGCAPADHVGKTDLDIWPRALAERYRSDDREVMRSGVRKVVEEPLSDRQGKTEWIETIKTPIVDASDRVIGTVGIARDITARKRIEEALRSKTHLLEESQRLAQIGSWEVDFVTGQVSWSDELYRLYGVSPDTFKPGLGSLVRLVHRENRKAIVRWIKASRAGERVPELEFRVVKPSGQQRIVRGSIEPVRDAAGNLVGAVGTGQDITERKLLEDQLKASEEKFRSLFEAAQDAIFIVDPQGRFIDLNRVAHERLGYTREEMLAKNVAEFVSPEFAARVPGRIEQIREFGHAVFESAHIRKDGTVLPVEVNSTVVDHAGRIALYSIIRDITDRKVAEDKIRAAKEMLEVLNRVQSQFIVESSPDKIFSDLLDGFLALTRSEYGFVGEVLAGEDGTPYLRTHAITDIAWDEESRALYEKYAPNFEFKKLDNLFGAVVKTGKPVIANDPGRDPRRGGLPPGHPALDSFLGLPISHGETLVGMVGVANRPGGYDEQVVKYLQPLSATCGNIVGAYRSEARRKEAEESLQGQKDFTENLIQSSSVATFVINQRHEVILWNKACEALTGMAAAEIIGSAEAWRAFYAEARPVLADLVLDQDLEKPARLYPVASRSVLVPDGLHAERWVDNLNGKDRYIVFDAAPIRDGSGRVVACIETIQDYTSRKRAEEAVAESEERYRNLFDNASDMIQSVAPDGRFLYVNAAWRTTLGYGQEDLPGLSLFDVVHPSCKAHCEGLFSKAMSGTPIDFVEATFVAKDGRAVEVEGSANVRIKGGKVVSTQAIFRDVTERKKLQEEIFRISHDWEETFDTITDMVTVHDRDFNIVRANKAAEKILGLPFLQEQPAKCFEYYHGTGCPPAGCPSCESLVTGKTSVSEMFEPHLGRDIEIRAIPRLDSAGQVAGLIHVVRDITERKRAEQAKKEQMLLAEFGMHVGAALNKEGELREVLGACAQFMVDDLGAALARIWTVSPDERLLVLQASAGIHTHLDGSHGRMPLDKELKIPTIARTRRPHLTNAVVGDAQVDQVWAAREGLVAFAGYPLLVGDRLVGVLGLFSRRELTDVAFNALETVANNIATGIERVQSEDSLKRYSDELSELNAASNSLLALGKLWELSDGICRFAEKVFGVDLVWLGLVDPAGVEVRIACWAGAGEEYLRTLRASLDDSPAGRGPTGLAIRTKQPQVARKDSPEFAPWRAAAEKSGFETSLAVPLVSSADGACIGALNLYSRVPGYFTADRVRLCQIFANQAAVAIENARLIEGLEEKIAVRTRDYESANIELMHLNRELELRRLEAESASRTKSDFLANMSHELRTPLNAIIGFSDLMTRGMAGPLEMRQKEFMEDILSSGKHLLSLINDILDLSKVEAGKMEIEPSEYDVADLVERSLVLFREKTLKHGIAIATEIEGTIAPAFGDARKMRQVLVNLLSNAVKFTPDGGSVTVRAREVPLAGVDFVEIAVSDTGIGISTEDQQRLFQPFSQLGHHLTKEHEGTGLGLALCKSLVELHGGSIRVESAPGRGSTFSFRVPLRFGKSAG